MGITSTTPYMGNANTTPYMGITSTLCSGHSGRAGMAALMLDTAYDKFDLAELYAVCNKNLPSFAMPVFIR